MVGYIQHWTLLHEGGFAYHCDHSDHSDSSWARAGTEGMHVEEGVGRTQTQLLTFLALSPCFCAHSLIAKMTIASTSWN